MATYGGDILEATFEHPTLGSGTLYFKSAEDSTVDYGGYMNTDDSQMVSGDGQAIYVLNRKRWKVEFGLVVWQQVDTDTLDLCQQLMNSTEEAEWTIQHSNGSIWGGTGLPVGDLTAATNEPFVTLIISGGGTLRKIA